MSWTDQQWDGFCALIASAWPTDFTEAERKAWRLLLDPLDPADAPEILKRLLFEGRRWRPSVSEFLAAARLDPAEPTWDEAYPLIYRAAAERRVPTEAHPLVASFVERQGVDRLAMLPLDDADSGGRERYQLHQAWDRHVAAFEGREVAALASGREGLRRLSPAGTAALVVGS